MLSEIKILETIIVKKTILCTFKLRHMSDYYANDRLRRHSRTLSLRSRAKEPFRL